MQRACSRSPISLDRSRTFHSQTAGQRLFNFDVMLSYVRAIMINTVVISQDPSSRARMTNFMREQQRRQLSMTSGGSDEATTAVDTSQSAAPAVSRESSTNDFDVPEAFLVCVYDVSPDIPYTILRAQHQSTAHDVIARVSSSICCICCTVTCTVGDCCYCCCCGSGADEGSQS